MNIAKKINTLETETSSFRLKKLRRLLNLTARDLSEQAGIPLDTLRSWESPNRTSLTDKGAIKIIEFFKSKNIDCTMDWLLYGYGLSPVTSKEKIIYTARSNDLAIDFQMKFKNSVIIEVTDNAMLPFLASGDLVGGIEYIGNDYEPLNNTYCIISDPDLGLVCRLIGVVNNEISAIPLNFDGKTKPLKDTTPTTLAKVHFIWKA